MGYRITVISPRVMGMGIGGIGNTIGMTMVMGTTGFGHPLPIPGSPPSRIQLLQILQTVACGMVAQLLPQADGIPVGCSRLMIMVFALRVGVNPLGVRGALIRVWIKGLMMKSM